MANLQVVPAAEFQALPLEFLISAPLTGVIKAQAIAAQATRSYIESFTEDQKDTSGNPTGRKKPVSLDLSLSVTDSGVAKSVEINAPLLSMLPIPHIRIDSFTSHFKFEISEVVKNSKEFEAGAGVDASFKIGPFASGTLKGSISSKAAEESVINRSGMMEITVHASEAPLPEGLAKLLTLLSRAIPENEKQ